MSTNRVSTIETIINQMVEKGGLDWRMHWEALHAYVHDLSLDEFESQINTITDTWLFRHLWSVGLNAYQQKIVLKRIRELGGEM